MFRGKESSNRIKLSRLVQDLILVFWAPCSSGGVDGWGWGVDGWGWGVDGWGWGVVEGCPHTCAHSCMRMHAHARVLNMIISCKWRPPLGESLGILYDVICMCVCMHVHVCVHVWGVPSHHPPPPSTHPPTPQGGPPESVKIQ